MEHVTTLKWYAEDLSLALKINKENVLRFLRDGRNSSFLLKFRLSRILSWSLVEGHNAPTQLVAPNGDVWVIKTCTKISGVSFCQNSMIGKGRKFNAKDFLESLKEYAGFLICDVDGFPDVPVHKIESRKVKDLYEHGAIKEGRMKYSVFTNIVNGSKK